ncbi:DEAD/DEAH box helicase [Azorhizophilus paspali]
MKLRDYQTDILQQLQASTSADLVQLDTGGGKTPIEAALAAWAPRILLVAHRNILIQQISEKLAAFGLDHDTISTEHTRRRCMLAHRPHGRNYIRRGHATRRVASIASLVSARRHGRLEIDTAAPWLIVIDEAHHVVPDNQWGQLREIFKNARIVGFTATPARMDGESLHVSKGGLFERLVQAEALGNDSVRVLIERGYLSDFVCYAARMTYNLDDSLSPDELYAQLEHDLTLEAMGEATVYRGPRMIAPSATRGLDYSTGELAIFGDPIREYRRLADGSRAILMAPAITNAEEFAEQFRAAGIPSACISSKQTPAEIARLIENFRAGHIRVLTNVDMVGEGFDLPACETLIIATRTASFPRYRQLCGRVLRPAPGKRRAIIIDHTGMVAQHGQPDEPVKWDLINPPKGLERVPTAPCAECGAIYKVRLTHCPECGAANALHERDQIGGYYFDIKRIDAELIAQARCERRKQQQLERLRSEIVWPDYRDGSDLVGRTIADLRRWFVARLQAGGVPIIDINAWLTSPAAADRQLWMTHFTAADLKSRSSSKPMLIYKKCIDNR